jgi:RNA polymerase sigma-70 factor (ECF subfamily)
MNDAASKESSREAEATERCTAEFRTTRWSLVLSAGHDSAPGAQAALEQLCRTYWYPLYAFLRRSGHPEADAEDLIQSFFVRLIERDWLATADPAKGRFRSFLLICLKRFVGGEARKAEAQKRGGRSVTVSLDDADAARRYATEMVEGLAPDDVYDRRWALTLLEQAWDRLREECQATGRLPLFEHLRAAQDGGSEAPSYEALAVLLNLTEAALKSALFRLRARYREVLRQEVAQTVSNPGEVDDEIRHLLQVLTR